MTSQTMTVRAAHFRSTGAAESGDLPRSADLPGLPGVAAAGCWVALRTRSRQERILAAELVRCGMTAWTPTVHADELFGTCRVAVERPLFPGYVFLHGDLDGVARAMDTGRVLDVVNFGDQEGVSRELADLWRTTAQLAARRAPVASGDACAGQSNRSTGATRDGETTSRAGGHGRIAPAAELAGAATAIRKALQTSVR